MRTILHSDLNNFYASVECVYNPELRKVPLAVCGDPEARHGIVLAKNDLAKRMGIKTGEAIWQARQKCPNLQVLPPNFKRYMRFAEMMHWVENSISSVRRCHFHPPASSSTRAAMKKPVPETAQLVFRVRRDWLRYFASRMNHTP